MQHLEGAASRGGEQIDDGLDRFVGMMLGVEPAVGVVLGGRKEDYVQPWLRRMVRKDVYGSHFIFKSMEQGPTFRVTVPKYPTKDPNHRILAGQRSRFTHD